MVKNLPGKVRDRGSIPGQGTRIPCLGGQLKPEQHNWRVTPCVLQLEKT